MADDTVLVSLQQLKPIKIIKWKVSAGCAVSIGRVILLYDFDGVQTPEQRKLKSSQAGTVHELIAPEGAVVRAGEPLLRLKACVHPTVMKDMCAECGADLRKEDANRSASVPMVHSIPELKVSEEVAQKLGRADGERLIRDRKLVLLVDLDQTLIHTTNDNIPPNIKDVYHFQLFGPNSPWYHTRLRPGTHTFLSNISKFFELHICTFGARNYAHMIAMFLDNDQAYFANRILSRDECFDPTSKKANLRALFPCGDDMVCIIDDREDVWNHASNLIHVKPYHFFKHTGDINAPPGLDKQEADSKDSKDGVDLSNIKKTKLNGKSEQVKESSSEGSEKEESNERNGVDATEEQSKEQENVLKATNGESSEFSDDKQPSETEPEAEEPKKEEAPTSDEKTPLEEENKEEFMETEDAEIVDKVSIAMETKECEESKKNYEKTDDDYEKLPAPEIVQKPPENDTVSDTQKSKDTLEEMVVEQKEETETGSGSETKPKSSEDKTEKDEDLVEIEDSDDYLLYLEDILKLVHRRFYEEYDKLEAGRVPDLKVVIPAVRSEILKGCRLVFSGLVPTIIKLEQSKAYQVARSLGAIVTQDIDDESTHLVAVRPGTAKVNAGRRKKHLQIVTPDWLWACAERWERIEEAIYPLSSKGSKNRHPPPHCSSPEHMPSYPTHDQPAARKRTPSGRFMDTINPLMSFSSDDIADMDKEVEDILDDDDTDSDNDADDADNETENEAESENNMGDEKLLAARLLQDEGDEGESSSSAESMTAGAPRGFKRMRQASRDDDRTAEERADVDDDGDGDSTMDQYPSAKCRRGEDAESANSADDSNSDASAEPQDEADDGEWNMMGAALEREFLSNN